MNMRRLLLLVGAIGLTLVIAAQFASPHKVIEAFLTVHWYVWPLLIVVQLISYYANARYFQKVFQISGREIGLKRLYETSFAVAFANQVIPTGGIAGTTYLATALRPQGITTASAALAQLGHYIFKFVSFFAVLAFGFLALFWAGDIDRVTVRIIILLMLLVLGVGVILLATFADRRRLELLTWPLVKFVNRVGRVVLRRNKAVIPNHKVEGFMDEFYRGYREIMSHKRAWPTLLRWTLLANLAEVATVYAVFVGFGLWSNPGVVIAGYTLAIMASGLGAVIGGLGVYEAGMIGTFVALGLPFALSFAIVTVYRVSNLAIFLPVGWHYYRRDLGASS